MWVEFDKVLKGKLYVKIAPVHSMKAHKGTEVEFQSFLI